MTTMTSVTSGTLAIVAAALASIACQTTEDESPPMALEPAISKPFEITGGVLRQPSGYREWIFVGEPLTPNEMNNGKAAFPEFHSVYIDPASYAHYEETGDFRDGTILVKELLSVGSKAAVSGKGYFMGDFIGLEATVKSAEHFPDEPGNWAYFSFTDPKGGHPATTAEAFPTASCNACHQSSASEDFVFTQYYPVLRAAKGAGRSLTTSAEPFRMNTSGQLQRPEGYRKWIFVGEPVTPNDMNDGKAPFPEFHSVYIDPESYSHLERTGEFRDGTILVKELVSVGSKQAVSGNGYFMGDFIGLEATIKSAKHFPNEPGNWAYFSFTDPSGGAPAATADPFPAASCNACHMTNADDDFVFTQYYPVLRDVMGKSVESASSEAAADPTWLPSADTPAGVHGGVPVEEKALFAYLQAKEYRSFPASEGARHPGRGPHTTVTAPVRVFYNEVLENSLAAGNDEHPAGAASVKEMFGEDGELAGWAVMVKTQATTDEGRGWFWYEATSTTDATALAASGNGVPGCVSCHSFRDEDMILTGHPLK
ncbi:MAG: cytochrome c553 [Planctomycetota bacterium]|jgi:cytochrome c553